MSKNNVSGIAPFTAEDYNASYYTTTSDSVGLQLLINLNTICIFEFNIFRKIQIQRITHATQYSEASYRSNAASIN